MLSNKATDKNFWKKVREDKRYEPLVNEIKKLYEKDRYDEIPVLKYSNRIVFYKTGTRFEFENDYFRRRGFLCSAAILALIYPEEEKYLTEVQDVLWAICDEYCWALPAHTKGEFYDDQTLVDLFDSETGATVCEVLKVLDDRLDEAVKVRAKIEVNRRVIEAFRNRNNFWWINTTNNWAAVCIGGVAISMLYLAPEIFEEQKERILKIMRNFLSGYPDDGTCMEGFSYWGFGFGNFIWAADAIAEYTNGEIDFFKDEKVKRIAQYPQRSFMMGNTCASYSDSVMHAKTNFSMQYFLHSKYPDDVCILPDEYVSFNMARVMLDNIRAFLYFDPDANVTELERKDYYLAGANQVILNKKNFSFAAKGGCNNEPHNHNDVGCFIISDKDGQAICDFGAQRYTKEYFKDDKRYSYFCPSSRSHSVPIINGQLQNPGKGACGTLKYDSNGVDIDFENAYGIEELKSLHRHFDVSDEKVLLKDTFVIDSNDIVERFVSDRKPEINGNEISFGSVCLTFNKDEIENAGISEEKYQSHKATEGEDDMLTAYLVDFKLKNGVKEFNAEFKVK